MGFSGETPFQSLKAYSVLGALVGAGLEKGSARTLSLTTSWMLDVLTVVLSTVGLVRRVLEAVGSRAPSLTHLWMLDTLPVSLSTVPSMVAALNEIDLRTSSLTTSWMQDDLPMTLLTVWLAGAVLEAVGSRAIINTSKDVTFNLGFEPELFTLLLRYFQMLGICHSTGHCFDTVLMIVELNLAYSQLEARWLCRVSSSYPLRYDDD